MGPIWARANAARAPRGARPRRAHWPSRPCMAHSTKRALHGSLDKEASQDSDGPSASRRVAHAAWAS
eukprot:7678699-Pyramimonas_sp.AAC.1